MLRALGMEVLWSPENTALCPGETALWKRLTRLIVPIPPLPMSPLATTITAAAQCRTDVDDCDCGPSTDPSARITISHLLDERRGFYHFAVVLSSWSPLPVTSALSVETILPHLAREMRSQNLTTNGESCVARHHFPLFFEWKYDMPGTRQALSVVPIPFHSSASADQHHLLHLRGALGTTGTFRLPRTPRDIPLSDLLLLAGQLRQAN
jgi:hypothetical protein